MKLVIKGHEVLIDDEDFALVSRYRWHISDSGYAVWRGKLGGKKNQTVRMHRLIMNTPLGMETDHINRNRLDNRKSNLKICDHKTNMLNSSRVVNAKGYSYNRTRETWQWQVNSIPRKRFRTEQEAIDYVAKRKKT